MTQKYSDGEKKIIMAIKKLKGKDNTKNIAGEAKMSPATASKYLSILEGKGVVIKDISRLPHFFWELLNEDSYD